MSDIKLVVFDCDGTMVDSQHMICAAMNGAFTVHGLALPDPVKVRRVVGLSLVEAVARLLPDADPEMHVRLAEQYKTEFRHLRETEHSYEPLYPGVKEVLVQLSRAGYLLGVATGKSRRGLIAALDRHGLSDFFLTLQTADDAAGKPHPQMVLQAMAAAGAAPQHTVVVGDTSFDMEMARSARAGAVGVAWGYHEPEELKASGASEVISELSELLPLVEKMLGRR
jgi:phosphoglycolate phosphatase